MAIFVSNLVKNSDFLLKKSIRNIFVQTRENIMHWGGDDTKSQYSWKDAGYAEEGEVTVQCKPSVFKNIDKQTLQHGYDCEFSITFAQFYSMYQFEEFKNKVCLINLNGIQTYLKDVVLSVEIDAKLGDGKGMIKISGTKYVENLRDFIDGNPFGTLPAPWPTASGTMMTPPSDGPVTGASEFSYEYLLNLVEPTVAYVTPSSPQDNSAITAFNLTLVDETHAALSTGTVVIGSVKHFGGDVWTTIAGADYDVVFADGQYVLQVNGTHTYALGDKVLVAYSW